MTADSIREVLKQVKYPGYSRDIVSFGLVKGAGFVDGVARVSLALSASGPETPRLIKAAVENCLRAQPGVSDVIVEIDVAPAPARTQAGGAAPAAPVAPAGIRHSIAIASGKGGVGKSTFAVNLACALARILAERGSAGRVGLLDCDIYGPSAPLMMGISGRPFVDDAEDGSFIIPPENHGVKVMSMGFLTDENTPVVWRGPMLARAVQQFVHNVKWGALEVLLVDLPPGTGDAQLSLAQTLPLDGALIVTTPQPAATQSALKGGLMFQKLPVPVPVLGVVENMSWFTDPAGIRHELFGSGGGARVAGALGVPLLGQTPIVPAIREGGDTGVPVVVGEPESEAAAKFLGMGAVLLEKIAPAQCRPHRA